MITEDVGDTSRGYPVTDSNPWIRSGSPPVPGAPRPAPPTLGPVTVSSPQGGVPVPDQADRLPRRESAAQATVWWLGVHGGAGESSLSLLAAGSRAADHAWPMPAARGLVNRVVLVARTNYTGLTAAQRAAREWASGSLEEQIRIEGLVLVPDQPGRMPKPLRLLSQLVGGGVPRIWSLPWVDAWRFGPVDPSAEPAKGFGVLFSDLSLHSTAPRT